MAKTTVAGKNPHGSCPEPSDCRLGQHFWHKVNGQHYTSIGMSPEPSTVDEYHALVKEAYGDVRGVLFGTHDAA